MLRTKSASDTSSTATNSSCSNCLPTARTHASWSGDVAVPQIAYLRTARVYRRRACDSAKEVALARHQEVHAAAVSARPDPPDDRRRHAGRLPEDELGSPGDLVGDGDLRRVELVAGRVAHAPEVAKRLDPRDAEGDVRRALAEGAAEGVAHDHADVRAGQLAQAVAQAPGGRVRVDGEQHHGVGALRIREVDSGRCADEQIGRAS